MIYYKNQIKSKELQYIFRIEHVRIFQPHDMFYPEKHITLKVVYWKILSYSFLVPFNTPLMTRPLELGLKKLINVRLNIYYSSLSTDYLESNLDEMYQSKWVLDFFAAEIHNNSIISKTTRYECFYSDLYLKLFL